MNLPSGTVLTWEGSWRPGLSERFTGSSENDISAQLSQLGFIVKNIQISALSSAFGDLLGKVNGIIQLQVSSGNSFNDNDAATGEQQAEQVIEAAIYAATGNPASSGSITKIQLASAGAAPGAPLPGTAVSTACQSGIGGWFGSLFGTCTKVTAPSESTDFLSSLSSKGTLYIGLAVLGFVAALALIGYSGALKRT